jgi:hypothetical protein
MPEALASSYMHVRQDSISTNSGRLGCDCHGDRHGWVHLDVSGKPDADREPTRFCFA